MALALKEEKPPVLEPGSNIHGVDFDQVSVPYKGFSK
jgi:hypothetical protein